MMLRTRNHSSQTTSFFPLSKNGIQNRYCKHSCEVVGCDNCPSKINCCLADVAQPSNWFTLASLFSYYSTVYKSNSTGVFATSSSVWGKYQISGTILLWIFAMATSTLEACLKCVFINDENNPAGKRKPHIKPKVCLPNVLQSCFLIWTEYCLLTPTIFAEFRRQRERSWQWKGGIPKAKGTHINSPLETMSNFKQAVTSSNIQLVQNSNRSNLLRIALVSSQALRQSNTIVPVGSALPKPPSRSSRGSDVAKIEQTQVSMLQEPTPPK